MQEMRGRRERGVKRFKTSSFMWFLRQDGTETAQRIVLPQNAGKPEEHGSGERVPWQNRGELFSTRRFDGGQLPGASTEDSLMDNIRQPETPTMGREIAPRRGRIRQSNG